MNIVASKVRQEGNTLIFKTTPAVGVLALTAFTDDATSTDVSATFIKRFRYTSNGVIYSEWIDLTLDNIATVQLNEKGGVFVAEIGYFLSQPTGADYLSVTEASFTAVEGVVDESVNFYFNNSLFKKYFNTSDPDVLNWYINVLEKLYDVGMVPNYIKRVDRNGSVDDYLSLFGSVAKFFAFYVKLARVFGSFYNNQLLITDFLSQRGLQISPEDTLDDLQYMMQTYYYQMSDRGSVGIADSKANGAIVDGELLRTIHYKPFDEFLFCLYPKQNFGWNLRNSSPLHRGVSINDILNKAPWSKGAVSMESVTPFLIGGATNTSSTVEVDNTGGGIDVTLADAILVDPSMDYQFSFKLKLADAATVTFNIAGYDVNNNTVTNYSRATGNPTNNFFLNANMSRSDKYIEVRCYLYNKNRGQFTGDTTNIRQGRNIIANANLAKVVLQVVTSGVASIKDFKIMPMNTIYSRGFVQVNNFISIWLKNHNSKFSLKELRDFISTYLIPYNTHLKITNIGDVTYTDPEVEVDSTYWVGVGEYCRKVVWIGEDPSCEIQSTIWIPDESTAICEQE